MEQKLRSVFNLLMQVHVAGEDTYKMVVCLNTLKECIAEAGAGQNKEGE